MSNNDQKKGMLISFTAIMFITPDSLLIRLANLNSWNLIFYRGLIPFAVVFLGLLIIYKKNFLKEIINNGWHGFFYACTFTITNGSSADNANEIVSLLSASPGPLVPVTASFPVNEAPTAAAAAAISSSA